MNLEPEEINVTEKKITEDLPMITWLKGDESYFEEFSWDAKKVMEVLGIKRSRLTQISGQELRVGKARIDRYLRPFYRPEDVQNYLKWTQPTASHKRSTSIVEEARKKLVETAEDLKKSLNQQPSGLQKFFSKLNQQVTQNLYVIESSFYKKLITFFEKFKERVIFDNQRVFNKIKILEKQIEKIKHDNQIMLQQIIAEKNYNEEILQKLKELKQDIASQKRKELTRITFPKQAPLLRSKSFNLNPTDFYRKD